MKTIYLNVSDENNKNDILLVCQRLGVKVENIGSDSLNKTLLSIFASMNNNDSEKLKTNALNNIEAFNSQGSKKAPALYNLPEFMIFNGFADEELDEFLHAYRAAGIPKIQLKAVVTPFNIGWTLYELIEHLKEEANLR